jgi:hypothetical protein
MFARKRRPSPGTPNPAPAPQPQGPVRRPQAPKKSATPDEARAIQQKLDAGHEADRSAAELELRAQKLKEAKDSGAAAAERAAHAKRLEAGGIKQEAINLAVTAYGIDITHVKSLLYDDDPFNHDSETDDEGNVTIRDGALTDPANPASPRKGAFTDPANLASTIAHESEVHVNQQNMKGRNYHGPQGFALNEIQGYDFEIASAPRFGMTPKEIEGLRTNRDHFLNLLQEKYKQRRLKGDYTLEKGHEDD